MTSLPRPARRGRRHQTLLGCDALPLQDPILHTSVLTSLDAVMCICGFKMQGYQSQLAPLKFVKSSIIHLLHVSTHSWAEMGLWNAFDPFHKVLLSGPAPCERVQVSLIP